jgi:hypothetical protein
MSIGIIIQNITSPMIIFGGGAWILIEKTSHDALLYILFCSIIYGFMLFGQAQYEEHIIKIKEKHEM